MAPRALLPILLVLLLTACGAPSGEQPASSAPATASFRELTVAELAEALADKDFVLVNVHIPYEGDIPGTDLSIPYNKMADEAPELLPDKDAKIVLYCRSGSMSRTAAQALAELGYTNVWDVPGGMIAWKAAGQPIEVR